MKFIIEYSEIKQSNKVVLVINNNEPLVKELVSSNFETLFCHINLEGYDLIGENLYDEHLIGQIVTELDSKISSLRDEGFNTCYVLGINDSADVALDMLIKGSEFLDGAALIKPLLNIAITDSFMTDREIPVLVVHGKKESTDQLENEDEIVELLEVNGFNVEEETIDEGSWITKDDVGHALNWLNKKLS